MYISIIFKFTELKNFNFDLTSCDIQDTVDTFKLVWLKIINCSQIIFY